MSELRWTLLILGVMFILVLSWWERRRPRQAFAPRLRAASSHKSPDATPAGEPWIGESTLSDVVLAEVALAAASEAREPEASGHSRAELPAPLEELPTLIIPDADEQVALEAAWSEGLPEPTLIDPGPPAVEAPAKPAEPGRPEAEIAGAEGVGAVRILEPAVPPTVPGAGALGSDPAVGAVPTSIPAGRAPGPDILCGRSPLCGSPIVEWPAEESRRILALRVVAPQAERFAGRTLRLALAAEGFLLGKFSIFHKPDETNRAVLSAAALTRPGSFDLETMDSQRYAGLSLFAVLPGSKPPPQAFEELLTAARNLNERLQGALQDERGSPLTTLRVTSLRESLRAEAATLRAACGE